MTNAEELQLARRWTFPEEDRAQFWRRLGGAGTVGFDQPT